MNKFKTLVLAILVLLVAALPIAVWAQSSSQLQGRISELNAEISRKQDELDSISHQADTLANKLGAIEAEMAALQAKINLAQLQIADTKAQIEDAIARLDKQKRVMFENARTLYKTGTPSTIEILASSENFSEYINKQEYLETVKESVNRAAKEIMALRSQLLDKQKELEEFVNQQEIQRQIMDNKRSEQASLLEQTRGEEARYQATVQDLKEQKQKAEASLVASLSSGSYRVSPAGWVNAGDVIGSVGNTGLSSGPHLHLEVRVGGSPTDPAPYIKVQPVQPTVITQPYGNADSIYRSGRHPGVDYGGGSAIRAIDSGNMYRGCSDQLLGTSDNAYGYVAIIEHGGHISVYAHMAGGPAECNYNTYY